MAHSALRTFPNDTTPLPAMAGNVGGITPNRVHGSPLARSAGAVGGIGHVAIARLVDQEITSSRDRLLRDGPGIQPRYRYESCVCAIKFPALSSIQE